LREVDEGHAVSTLPLSSDEAHKRSTRTARNAAGIGHNPTLGNSTGVGLALADRTQDRESPATPNIDALILAAKVWLRQWEVICGICTTIADLSIHRQ
jgi:hypothetical protein